MKTPFRWLAAAPVVFPAVAGAHSLVGAPHSHDAASWGGFAAATALCWAAYRGAQWLSSRRGGASRQQQQRQLRPAGRRADARR